MDGWIGWHHALPASLLLSPTSLSLPWQELPSREREKEREREKQKLLEDVVDEIFDMVKPRDPNCITHRDLVQCKVGETVVNILTDVYGFLAYDQREQLMHSDDDK